MVNAINLLIQTPSLGCCTFKTTRAIPSSLPYNQLKLCALRKEGAKHNIFINRKVPRLRRYHVAASLDASDDPTREDPASLPSEGTHDHDAASYLPLEGSHDHDVASDLPLDGSHDHDETSGLSVEESHDADKRKSMSKTITEFYECINGNDMDRLAKILTENCCFDDYSFPEKFEGKKEVRDFFTKLTNSMGENVKFKIEEICEGDGLAACAIWHIEWKGDRIPFTRGCTIFKCLQDGDKMLIREAQVLIESPVKPGVVVVGLLDLVRSVFDDFPNFTRWFLQSPVALLQILVNIYNLVGAPFINPLLMVYTQIWKLICNWFNCMIRFYRYIIKLLK